MRYKYPRTVHLPFSPGCTSDDKMLVSTDHFVGKQVVISIKQDGENTTIYRDGFHARSLDSRHHPSRDWIAKFQASIGYDIPEGCRICGENMYARHSVAYDNLPSYFLGFSVWYDDYALSWDETLEYFEILGITSVPVIYTGLFDLKMIEQLAKDFDTSKDEGFVVRLADRIKYDDFGKSVAKWVRANHVQTSDHWMHKSVVPNRLI